MIKRYRALVYATFVFMLVSLSCNAPFTSATPHQGSSTTPSPANTNILPSPSPEPTKPKNTETSPVSEGSIQVEYVYTENLVTALYHLYGTVLDNFVDITISNPLSEPAAVIVQTEVDGYTSKASDTVEVAAGESITIHQNPLLIPESVDRLNSQKPGNFHIRVISIEDGDDQVLIDETEKILIYSRRDFVWIPGFDWTEEYELWAAWVTPNDPAVEALIRAAANYDPTGIITSGYGKGPNDEDGSVYRRLEAVWQAEEQDYNLTYISTMTTFAPGTVQRMRLPAEVLEQSSGNCVELAALFASVAEALGLETAIVRIPGHAYTAIRTDLENAQYYFIETTMIGRASFSEAVNYGSEEWDDAKPHFDANEEGYAWVTIPEARAKGILPIPWR